MLKEVTKEGQTADELAREAAKKAEAIETLFKRYIEEGKIVVDREPGVLNPDEYMDKYIVARSTLDKEEAVAVVERLDQVHQFDRIKQTCFVNGMVDGIETYRKQIIKLDKPLGMEKALKIGEGLLQWIKNERHKI